MVVSASDRRSTRVNENIPAGTVRRHPEWPAVPEIAMRSNYQDGQFPGWTSWLKLSPSGSEFVTPESVSDWPAAAITAEP